MFSNCWRHKIQTLADCQSTILVKKKKINIKVTIPLGGIAVQIFSTSACNRRFFSSFSSERTQHPESKLPRNITAGKSLKSKSPIYCPHCAGRKKKGSRDSGNPNGFRTSFYRYGRCFFVFVIYLYIHSSLFSVVPSRRAINSIARGGRK